MRTVSRRITRRAGARLRNCMTRSSRRRRRWESTIAADICRTGAGVKIAHGDENVTINEREGEGPWYHVDYCFPDDEFDRLTVLVVIERYTKMQKEAVVAPSMGSTGSYAARMIIELINECGDRDQDVILMTDQEAAIKFFVDDVCV